MESLIFVFALMTLPVQIPQIDEARSYREQPAVVVAANAGVKSPGAAPKPK